MERKFVFSVGEFYHIYNRGNNKQAIFLNDNDRNRFNKLLYVCNSTKPVVFKTIQGMPLDKIERDKTLVDIGAYCLMPNHFHLLLHEKIDNGISRFLEKLSTAYSMYFNKKYDRTGKLFEGRFKANHTDNDEYLKYLFSYIHLNPIKMIDSKWKENGVVDRNGAKKYLEQYNYSSYFDYIGRKRVENAILNKKDFPDYFADIKEFQLFIDEWLSFSTDNITT
ncbi:MAG: transposase [Candidatus Zambryskibacteria bacterium]|nr:transposase [Candidatus Zambryskibacteria bacterium]